MSYLPQTKFGDCGQCGAKDTNVVKVGKEYFCIQCHQNNKTAAQIKKAAEKQQKQKVRGLITYQQVEAIVDSIQELVIDLDRVTSRMVRLMAMEKDGTVQCFTCPAKKALSLMHCGHFIPRANMVFRFDHTYNLRVQCPNCNVTLRGNLVQFAANLELERPGIVVWMQQEARKIYSPTRDELKQMLFDYQQRVNILENKFR